MSVAYHFVARGAMKVSVEVKVHNEGATNCTCTAAQYLKYLGETQDFPPAITPLPRSYYS